MDRRSVQTSGMALALLLLLLFTPLPWSVSMQCETRPAQTQAICARQDGYLLSLDVADGQSVKTGQTVFTQSNPFFDWTAREEVLKAKSAGRELDQIRSNRKRLEEQDAQFKRLEGAVASVEELERRKAQLQVKSSQDGVLLLYDRHLKPGKWLSAGDSLGELFAPESMEALAYAEESDVGRLRPGDKVALALPGVLKSYAGTIISVNAVPLKSPASLSPLLDVSGGPLQTVSSPEDRSLRLLQPLYMVRVALAPTSGGGIPAGRTGVAKVRKFHSLGVAFLRWTLSTLQRELSL